MAFCVLHRPPPQAMASPAPVSSVRSTPASSRPVSAVSTDSTATIGLPANQSSFEELFKSFAKFGDIKSDGHAMTLSNSDKWMKQAKVIGPKALLTTTDTGIAFKQIAKTKKALSIAEYQSFLGSLAKAKKIEADELKAKLRSAGPPATTKTTSATASAAVARLTDHTKYTGIHKLRFDEAGKGRGMEGRVDAPPKSGYVQGYKDDGSFDKVH